jgi:uncharacterized DUF497 family protein
MILIRRLRWDDWNIAHIARHRVTPEEVEQVCHGHFVLLRGKKGRVIIVGPTHRRRLLAVVLEPEPEEEGVYYPVTARPAARKERRLYQEWKGGEFL